MALDTQDRAVRRGLRGDFARYAEQCLLIRPKAGGLVPFRLNAVQRHLHERAEAQLRDTGRVRAIVLKARQPGVSTYVEGRFYWKVTHRRGVRAYILTHSDQATTNLFAIAKRFHDNCPAMVRPAIRASNARELDFGALDSGYRVGTAKAAGVGRSDTIQRIHGVTLVLLDSMNTGIGPDRFNLTTLEFRQVGNAMDTAVPLFTGEAFVELAGDYELDARFVIRGDSPGPFVLLAVAPELKTNDLV